MTFFATSPTNHATNFLVSGGDQAKLALMRKKKKDFDYMTSSVLLEHQKHLLASLHFKAVYNRLLFVPSIGITLVSGVFAVLAQSGLCSKHTSSWLTVWIAILAAFSVFWQSLMKQLDYGGRASLHDSTANALNKIFKLARMRAKEQQIEDLDDAYSKRSISKKNSEQPLDGSKHEEECVPVTTTTGLMHQEITPDEDGPDEPEEKSSPEMQVVDAGEDHFTLSKQFEQAVQGCTSVVPIKISTAFDALDSRIDVSNKRLFHTASVKPKISWEKVYPALYQQMTLTIVGSKLWPYAAPGADWAVEKTIRDFQTQDACLLKFLVERAQQIDREYNNLAPTRNLFGDKLREERTPLLSVNAGETV
eukprot:CAMPEP_0181087446 /NCGR_PEP_ID=MMETSP1071-20121207/6276_1 /TAXON_ID=35127 /ORGANISM="Thalassiosira sp., Strain NH16" /LENGTH=362 /DNA_ID=CAMNT_0023169333 /DNA_START=12 /DNA_END=1100 /DNA_ORIENTATION=-